MSQMCFRQRYEPVETLTTYRPDHAFAEAVRHWTVRRRVQNTQPEAADRGVELPREDAVAVMKQITVVGVRSEGLGFLRTTTGAWRANLRAGISGLFAGERARPLCKTRMRRTVSGLTA
jgi:hypothetical protein